MNFLLKKYRLLIIVLIIPNIFLIFVTTYRTDQSVTLTGGLTLVDDYYVIDDGYQSSGSFNSLFVISFDNSTIFQNFILQNNEDSDTSEVNEAFSHMNDLAWYTSGVIQKEQSQEASIITSYTTAALNDESITIDYSFIGSIVYLTTKYDSVFEIGDIITHVNGVALVSNDEFRTLYSEFKVDDVVTIIRDNEIIERTLISGDSLGAYTYDKYEINEENTYPNYKLNSTTTVGPSAGLLQTLSLYNQLIELDISYGLTVCGTGTIDINGNIGAIGGIKQKIITAHNNGADIFLCPIDNYDDALAAYNELNNPTMKLYSVSTFDEALERLALYE